MDGTMAEIRGFGGNYAPRNWTICNGALLSVSQYSALFSLLGTIYGGDGRTTFALPNLEGRVPIGSGSSYGGSNYVLGQQGGAESVSIALNQLPAHTHSAAPNLTVTGTATGNVELPCYNEAGEATSPGGNILANIGSGYMEAGEADAKLAPASASLSLQGSVQGSIDIGSTGNGSPISNMQPFTTINWIICLTGLFPSRN